MKWFGCLVALVGGACSSDLLSPSPGPPPPNVFFDIGSLSDTSGFLSDVTGPDGMDGADGEVVSGDTLIFEGPTRLLPGRPAPFAIRRGDRRSEVVSVSVGAGNAVEVVLHRGRGVLQLQPDGFSSELRVRVAGEDVLRAVVPFEAGRDVRVTDDLVVEVGQTVVWPAGARVMIAADATVRIEGRLEIQGTPDEPVLVTSATSNPWGTIEVSGELVASHTWFTSGGTGTPRFGGHSASNPVVAVVGGRFEMVGGGLTDNVGKAIHAESGQVDLQGVLIARCDTGGEYVESVLRMVDSHVVEIPDGDGIADDDDNDGSYFRLALMDVGYPLKSEIIRSVFSSGEDDGIDHNGGYVVVRDTIVEGFLHEGIAASNGGRVEVVLSLIRGAAHGIEVGYGAPEVIVKRSTLTGSKVGLRWGDEYEWEAKGTLRVEGSVVSGNETDLVARDPQQGEAPTGSVVVVCSAVGEGSGVVLDEGLCLADEVVLEGCEGPFGWECAP